MSASRGICSSIIVLAILVAGPAHALVHFDFEQKYFNDPGYPVLDHCLVQVDSVFHLFYLRGNPAESIGHAITTDFVHWQKLTPLLSPGTWDNRALWAPHVIQRNGIWYMFYTGVNQVTSQQTGVAFSTDLYQWYKLPWPVYHPSTAWAEWTETGFAHGRDPHVIPYNNKFYMFVTAKTFLNQGAVGLAESLDMINWTDIGPAYVHNIWHVLESVFVFEHGPKWHMLFTEETVSGTSHMTSDASPLSGWDFGTRRLIDVGHAPQVTFASSGAEIFSRHSIYNDRHGYQLYTLRFDTLTWVGDIPAPVKPWPLAGDWEIVSGNAFSLQPVFRNNPYARGENVADTFEGDCWIGTYEAYTGPMGFGTVANYQGDDRTGVIRSHPFTITGNSMNLLVGGGNYPGECYVALVEQGTGAVLHSETGRNNDEMDRRYWDLVPHIGKTVYIEIADLSVATFGHINTDDIRESDEVVSSGENGNGSVKDRPGRETVPGTTPVPATLCQNAPNPFNPATTIAFELAASARARIDIFDISGSHVRILTDRVWDEGRHSVAWNGDNESGGRVKSGIYFYRLSVNGAPVATLKMVLLK